MGRRNPPRPPGTHRYDRRCLCFFTLLMSNPVLLHCLYFYYPPFDLHPCPVLKACNLRRHCQPATALIYLRPTATALLSRSPQHHIVPDYPNAGQFAGFRIIHDRQGNSAPDYMYSRPHTPTQTRAYTKTQFANTSPRLLHLRKKHLNHRWSTPSGIPRTGPW